MKEGWEKKKLGEVCDIYQPQTISTNELVNDGLYPVFGANGIIGHYDKYNHEDPEILLTCRGATCGTINVSLPKSWINGNAMVIKRKTSNLNFDFLKYLMKSLDYSLIITGAAQPQITRQSLSPVKIPVPPLSVQESIVSELDMLSGIISKHKALQEEYDRLEQSIFYDMFGDPVTNEKGWEVKKLEELGTCCSGGTPSRKNPKYFEGDINWFSAGELNTLYVDNSLEKITQEALETSAAKLCPANSLFIGMYDTAAFKMSIPKVESCSNQACANIVLNKDNVIWLYFVLQSMKEEALKNRHGARQKNLNLGYIKSFQVPLPPLSLQQSFADKISAIEQMKAKNKAAQEETEMLFNERMAYYF